MTLSFKGIKIFDLPSARKQGGFFVLSGNNKGTTATLPLQDSQIIKSVFVGFKAKNVKFAAKVR